MNRDEKQIILVSYESGDFNSCPAEWADDKVAGLVDLGYHVTLVTSAAATLEARDAVRAIRLPSISFSDFQDELTRANRRGISNPHSHGLFKILPATLGRLFDTVFEKLAGGHSWGRYSWTLSALPVIVWLLIKNPGALLLATGGPSSGPLAASGAAFLTRREVILEFQDPVVGTQMTMSSRAFRVLLLLERFMIRVSTRTFFVTKIAAEDVRLRLPKLSGKVSHLYPGARDFGVFKEETKRPGSEEKEFEILHLGSLYGNRNLDTLFLALESIYRVNPEQRGQISITNLGNLAIEDPSRYLNRLDFTSLSPMPRKEALVRASSADYLLLVQHTDDRSQATIPYKTYDYLNLGVPVLGLVQNSELEELIIESGGLVAHPSDQEGIERMLRQALSKKPSSERHPPHPPRIRLSRQLQSMLEGVIK